MELAGSVRPREGKTERRLGGVALALEKERRARED